MIKSLTFYFLVGYFNQLCAINLISPVPNMPLYDVGFKLLPEINPKICDGVLIIMAIYFFFRWIFVDSRKIQYFARMMGWIMLIRICCFPVTAIPYPIQNNEIQQHSQICIPRQRGDPIRWNVFPYLYDHHLHSCYDLMFSGHAAHATLIWLFTIIYTSKKFEKVIITIFMITCHLLIIASRIHYTHDVVIGNALAILMFGTFFSANQCPFFNKNLLAKD